MFIIVLILVLSICMTLSDPVSGVLMLSIIFLIFYFYKTFNTRKVLINLSGKDRPTLYD